MLSKQDSLTMELHEARTELLKINVLKDSLENDKGLYSRRIDEEIKRKGLVRVHEFLRFR